MRHDAGKTVSAEERNQHDYLRNNHQRNQHNYLIFEIRNLQSRSNWDGSSLQSSQPWIKPWSTRAGETIAHCCTRREQIVPKLQGNCYTRYKEVCGFQAERNTLKPFTSTYFPLSAVIGTCPLPAVMPDSLAKQSLGYALRLAQRPMQSHAADLRWGSQGGCTMDSHLSATERASSRPDRWGKQRLAQKVGKR